MELTERAKWLTEFFQEKARDWVEISTDELIDEYRKAFPEESPTPGYIYSQLEALEQMGMITIDRPEFGQKKPTRYIWSGGGAAPAPSAPVVEEAPAEMASVTAEPVVETAYATEMAYTEPVAAAAEPAPAASAEVEMGSEPAVEESFQPAPEPISVISSEPAYEAPQSVPTAHTPPRAAVRESSVSSSEAERKLQSLEEAVRAIRNQLEAFESAADELRDFIEEQGEIIERQVILDEPGLDYRMETVKIRKKG